MAVSIDIKPANVCFVADGVKYTISESVASAHAAKLLKFALGYQVAAGSATYATKNIELLYYPTPGDNNNDIYNVDLTDIIQPYIREYNDCGGNICGYATICLTHIDGNAVGDNDTTHLCLAGSSGELQLTGNPTSTRHPFLLSRGNEQGAVHFYRSELRAVNVLFAYKPLPYLGYYETDNLSHPDQDLDLKDYNIDGYSQLLGFRRLKGDSSSQYDVTADNAIFLHLYVTGHPNTHPDRMYTIAINDDPDTDETHLIRWINSMGAPEAILLTGALTDASDIAKPEMYITEQTLGVTNRAFMRRLCTTKYALHTGYLTPARVLAMIDMLSSDKVEMQIDDRWIPVSITGKNKHAVHQREPEDFELSIEVLEQTKYLKPNRTVYPIPNTRAGLLQDNSGNIIVDNNSNTIQENG